MRKSLVVATVGIAAGLTAMGLLAIAYVFVTGLLDEPEDSAYGSEGFVSYY